MAKKTGSSTLETFAEDLGKVLGTAENKARGWLSQRKDIAKQLTAVRDKADELLRELTGGAAKMTAAVNQARRGRPPGSKNKTAGKRRKMSAAARKAISDAQKARWAKQKGTAKKTTKKAKTTAKAGGGDGVGI